MLQPGLPCHKAFLPRARINVLATPAFPQVPGSCPTPSWPALLRSPVGCSRLRGISSCVGKRPLHTSLHCLTLGWLGEGHWDTLSP